MASYPIAVALAGRPYMENTPLASVTKVSVQQWVQGMVDDWLSASRTRQAFHLLTAVLEHAVDDQRLPRNPARGVSLPRLPQVKQRFLTHAQVDALARAAGGYAPLILTLAYGGLRWGEAVALRVGSFDLSTGRVRVSVAVSDVDGHLLSGSPKGAVS